MAGPLSGTFTGTFAGERLRRFARQQVPLPPPAPERCELCSEPLPAAHRHLLEIGAKQVRCACTACKLLFDHDAAGGGHYRLIPQRRTPLPGFHLDDVMWAGFGVPVDMAFFIRSGEDSSVTAQYPNPLGTVRTEVAPQAWQTVVDANPKLHELDSDVEALLVRRGKSRHESRHEYWLVAVDDCYRLAARVRATWAGMTGGDEVWREIDEFFTELRGPAPRA